jgi:hypothetical protein
LPKNLELPIPGWNNRRFPLFQRTSKTLTAFMKEPVVIWLFPGYVHENRSLDVFFFFFPFPTPSRELPWYPVGGLAPGSNDHWFWAISRTSCPVFLKEPAVIWQFPKVPELRSCISNTRCLSTILNNHRDNRIGGGLDGSFWYPPKHCSGVRASVMCVFILSALISGY